MGKCKFCNENAGFLMSVHAECLNKHVEGVSKVKTEINNVFDGTGFLTKLERYINESIEHSFMTQEESRELLIGGWVNAVEVYLEDGLLDEQEEKLLAEFKNKFSLSQTELNKQGAITRTVKAAVLRDLTNGIVPDRFDVGSKLTINLQKNEHILWAFYGCDYLEDKTIRKYVGSSQGISIRIAKGLYYRTSAFQGNPVEYSQRVKIDRGDVVITDKNVYFSGGLKSVRIPYGKIVSFIPFSNGFGILKDAATAKPQIFLTGDGWFSYNLVVNAARF
jgi:hypothetical protein